MPVIALETLQARIGDHRGTAVVTDAELGALIDIARAAQAYAHGRGSHQSLLDALARLDVGTGEETRE